MIIDSIILHRNVQKKGMQIGRIFFGNSTLTLRSQELIFLMELIATESL